MENMFETNLKRLPVEENNRNTRDVIPVLEESLAIGKEVVETGKVIISKKVVEEDITVNIPVVHEEVTVDKIAVNEYVDTAPEIRYDGDTMIVPIVKEVLVVEKRLMLTEELHITKNKKEVTEELVEKVRKEEVTVSRQEA